MPWGCMRPVSTNQPVLLQLMPSILYHRQPCTTTGHAHSCPTRWLPQHCISPVVVVGVDRCWSNARRRVDHTIVGACRPDTLGDCSQCTMMQITMMVL